MVAWAVRVRRHLSDTVVKPLSSGAKRSVVEGDEATPRSSAEGAGSMAAAGIATALSGVGVAETETDGAVKWRVVLQGGKPPREALRDNESEHNDDPLPGDQKGQSEGSGKSLLCIISHEKTECKGENSNVSPNPNTLPTLLTFKRDIIAGYKYIDVRLSQDY